VILLSQLASLFSPHSTPSSPNRPRKQISAMRGAKGKAKAKGGARGGGAQVGEASGGEAGVELPSLRLSGGGPPVQRDCASTGTPPPVQRHCVSTGTGAGTSAAATGRRRHRHDVGCGRGGKGLFGAAFCSGCGAACRTGCALWPVAGSLDPGRALSLPRPSRQHLARRGQRNRGRARPARQPNDQDQRWPVGMWDEAAGFLPSGSPGRFDSVSPAWDERLKRNGGRASGSLRYAAPTAPAECQKHPRC
jgi:hypothetical protein